MVTEQSIQALAQRIGAECKALRELLNGNEADLGGLNTSARASLVAAINGLQAQIDLLVTSGGGLVAYDFQQNAPAGTWTINHNLGRAVVAQVFDAGGNEVEVEWQQVTPNQVRVYFVQPSTGSARIS